MADYRIVLRVDPRTRKINIKWPIAEGEQSAAEIQGLKEEVALECVTTFFARQRAYLDREKAQEKAKKS